MGGKYRQNELNIGIAPHLVAAEMPVMFDNTRFWVENKTFQLDEIAVRLHHRLTQIHGFPNGNGRHGRMTADLLMKLKRILCGRGHPEIDFGSRRQDDRHCFGMDNADLLVGFDREESEDIIRRLPFLDLSHGRPVGPEPGKEGERPCLIESKPHRRLAPSGRASFSLKLVNGTTQRCSMPSQRRQCGDLTFPDVGHTRIRVAAFTAVLGDGMPHRAMVSYGLPADCAQQARDKSG